MFVSVKVVPVRGLPLGATILASGNALSEALDYIRRGEDVPQEIARRIVVFKP